MSTTDNPFFFGQMAGGLIRSRGGRFLLLVLLGAMWIGVCLYAPSWQPRCLFRTLTGCECPACGGQRAMVALLHGGFAEAFWLNPYLFVTIPYLILVLGTEMLCARDSRLRRTVQHRLMAGVFVLLMIAWWIFRNTAFWHTLTQ